MVNSKKRTKPTPTKDDKPTDTATNSTSTKSSPKLPFQMHCQAVNEACNLLAIITPAEDNNNQQLLKLFSIHDHQLLIQLNVSSQTQVTELQWFKPTNNTSNQASNTTTTILSSLQHSQCLIMGKSNGDIDIFDLKSMEICYTFKGQHSSNIVQLVQGSSQLISIDQDSNIVSWNLVDGECLKKWSDNNESISQIAYLNNTNQLLSVGKSVKLWSLENYEIVKTFNGIQDHIDLVSCFTRDRRIFITYSKVSKILLVFDLESKINDPLFKIQTSDKLERIMGIKDSNGLHIVALNDQGTLVGWLSIIPANIFHKEAYDLSKSAKHQPNYKLQFNKQKSDEVLPIQYLGMNTLYNVPIVSRGYNNRLGGFESLWIDFNNKSQNIKISRDKGDHLSIDKVSAKRKSAQMEATSTTVDSLDPIQSYASFPHSLAVEMIQYLNSGKLPTKTLVNLISQTVKYNQNDLIALHLTHIGIHQLIKILPHMALDHMPSLFNILLDLLSASRTLSARSLSWLRAILVYHRNSLMANGQVVNRLSEVLEHTTGTNLDHYTDLTQLEGRLRHIQQQIKLREHVETPVDELQDTIDDHDESLAEDVLSSKESAFEQGYSAFEDSDDDHDTEDSEDEDEDEEETVSHLDDKLAKVSSNDTHSNVPNKKLKK